MNDIGWCKKISPTSVKSALRQGHDLDLASRTQTRSQRRTNALSKAPTDPAGTLKAENQVCQAKNWRRCG
jgi:hypothetical protein